MQIKQTLGLWLLGVSLVGTCLPTRAAQPYQEYRKQVESAQTLTALTDDLMGDSVSLYNGATEFTATDISLPGNNVLPVQLKRRFSIEITPGGSPGSSAGDPNLHGAGNWDIEVPYISGVYGQGPWEATRCTNGAMPSVPAPLDVTDVWQGNTVHVPGAGDRKMLRRVGSDIPQPSDGIEREWTTRERDMFTCIPMQSGLAGEGFLMQTASGLRYYFDKATTRYAGYMTYQPSPEFQPMSFNRTKYYLLASKIVDRFGNTVTLTYNANGSPTSIASSDGRTITLIYSGTLLSTASVHDSISGTDRTWGYAYGTGGEAGMLKTVTQPDGSKWQYSHVGTLFPDDGGVWDGGSGPNCGIKPPAVAASFSITITHPSGAEGTFQLGNKRQPRSGVHANACVDHLVQSNGTWVHTYKLYTPNYFDVMALTQKTITGPGVIAKTWTYGYPFGTGALWGTRGQSFTYPCTTCPTEKTVTVHEPGDVTKEYQYGYLYASNEGRLLSTKTIDGDGVVKRIESTEYLPESAASGQNFYPLYGLGFGPDEPSTLAVRPVIAQTIVQDGATFSMQVDTACTGGSSVYCFDTYGNPTKVTKSSSLGYSKDEFTGYSNNTNLWVLGQVASSTVGSTIVSEAGYDSLARPTWTKAFGKPPQTLTYNADGTVATVKDGGDHITTLSSWKRGTPQTITYPATTDQPTAVAKKAAVDDNGWIRSITDENNYKTCYGYDLMGRISSVTYPSEVAINTCDTSAWATTTQSFQQVAVAEYGVPTNHWKQTVSTGNGRKVTYYDAFWRPLVEEAYDNADAANTRSVSVKRYDTGGRLAFQSYPMRNLTNYATVATGTTTTYDALDRVVQTSVPSTDSVTGTFKATTEYLDGFQTRVTDPRGNQTLTTMYQAYHQPTYDWPRGINHPEGAYTEIYRDVFGKPTAVKRRNSSSSVAATRSYAYNTYQELCRTIEPETGATLMGYDAAGNLEWTSAGLATSTACDPEGDTAAILARKTTRTYDARNRIKALVFHDHLGDATYAYTPDSLQASVTADNGGADQVTTQYSYNHRRLMTEERELWGSINWPTAYGYDTNGHLSQHTYYGGLVVTYAPNALGQPKQAGTYAGTVSYYPNGGIAGFTYGNNIAHTMTQNDRQLPENSRDAYGSTVTIDDTYDYDGNNNVAGITDALLPDHRGNRIMTYDGLDRLTKVESIKLFGSTNANYTYDVLDNLTRVRVGGAASRDQFYCYDATWRLTNVMTGSCTGTTVMGLGYDMQGNVANKSGQTFVFDYGNRLRGVNGVASYVYDGQGRRVRDYTTASKYSQYSSSGQLMFTSDARANRQSWYIYLGGSLVAIRERDMTSGVVVIKYQHTDALGSPVAVTDQARVVLERSEFEPFGKLLNHPLLDGPGYTGHVSDAATGLDYMQQRYYDPGIGRNLSVDPVTAYGSGDYRYFNRYAYAFNNPYRFTDPDGRCPSCVGAAIGGGLELAFQLATPEGRASYAVAGTALANGDFRGAFNAAGANVAKVAASAAAGAVGAGLAGKIAQGANLISKGIEGSSAAANVAANVGIKVAGNSAVGAGLGATTQGVSNAVSGQPLTQGMLGAAGGGAVGGAIGVGIEAGLTPAAQNLANGTGRMIGSGAGIAAPGATGSATALGERAGAIGGAAAEKAVTCSKPGGGC